MTSRNKLSVYQRRFAFCLLSLVIATASIFAKATQHVQTEQAEHQIQPRLETKQWSDIITKGKNQEVYFYAWAGDAQINQYIQWVADQVKAKYAIDLHHVKVSNTSDVVARVLAEKSANNHKRGSVDLVWINGDNFASMSKNGLLLKQWANTLPNFMLTDPQNNPAVHFDFGVPVNGMEAPWGLASLTFYYDSLAMDNPPYTLKELETWLSQHPGRFSYPKPPDYLGVSFLKYALVMLHSQGNTITKERALLNQPVTEQNAQQVLKPMWEFLDRIHPLLWRKGTYFPPSSVYMRRLIGDTELNLGFSFSAPEIPAAVDRYDLPKSIRSYAMQDGTLSNVHFVAIPYNTAHSEAAMLVANFLLSPAAQARKQKAKIWGDKTVLIQSMLNKEEQALFEEPTKHPSALPVGSIKRIISEPHPSWVDAINKGWIARYGSQQ